MAKRDLRSGRRDGALTEHGVDAGAGAAEQLEQLVVDVAVAGDAVPWPGPSAPSRSVKRPPASARITGIGARS